MIWNDMEWYGMIWNDMEWYGMIWNDMEWYGMISDEAHLRITIYQHQYVLKPVPTMSSSHSFLLLETLGNSILSDHSTSDSTPAGWSWVEVPFWPWSHGRPGADWPPTWWAACPPSRGGAPHWINLGESKKSRKTDMALDIPNTSQKTPKNMTWVSDLIWFLSCQNSLIFSLPMLVIVISVISKLKTEICGRAKG